MDGQPELLAVVLGIDSFLGSREGGAGPALGLAQLMSAVLTFAHAHLLGHRHNQIAIFVALPGASEVRESTYLQQARGAGMTTPALCCGRAVMSLEAEEHDVQMTTRELSGHGLETGPRTSFSAVRCVCDDRAGTTVSHGDEMFRECFVPHFCSCGTLLGAATGLVAHFR